MFSSVFDRVRRAISGPGFPSGTLPASHVRSFDHGAASRSDVDFVVRQHGVFEGLRVHYVPHSLEYSDAAALSALTADDFREFSAIAHPGSRNRSLATRAVLRRALSEAVDGAFAPEEWLFVRDENGKPCLEQTCPSVDFNCSHADGMSIVVVSTTGPVGVDLVSVHSDMDIELSEMFFAPGERRALGDPSKPTSEKRRAFCRYWAVKEACLKLNGDTLSEHVKEIELDPVRDQLKATPAGNAAYSLTRLKTWQILANDCKYSVAVAVPSA